MINNFKFGDIVDNGWASLTNPLKKGIFVREIGNNYQLTDGKGYFWETFIEDHKLKIIGTVLKQD